MRCSWTAQKGSPLDGIRRHDHGRATSRGGATTRPPRCSSRAPRGARLFGLERASSTGGSELPLGIVFLTDVGLGEHLCGLERPSSTGEHSGRERRARMRDSSRGAPRWCRAAQSRTEGDDLAIVRESMATNWRCMDPAGQSCAPGDVRWTASGVNDRFGKCVYDLL